MRRVNVFNFITLNGYFQGPNGDLSWHPHGGGEEGEFAGDMAQMGGVLIFGRVTYQMMSAYWPTPAANENAPAVADGMNKSEKIVFSRTLKKADWKNTRIISDNMIEAVTKLKEQPGPDMAILGSGSIVTQLAEAGLIDDYQFMLDPVALGEGTPLFKGMKRQLDLKLKSTRTFRSGIVLLTYTNR